MTPIEIAYFKHFMYDRGLEQTFNYLYRTRRVKGSPSGDKDGNPEKIEEYLLRVSREDVIMKAFTFLLDNGTIREDQSHDYWKDIDDKWQVYMKDNEDNHLNDSWPALRKTFAILRQNWDAKEYWRRENFESTAEVYARMHINLPLPEKVWEHGYAPTPPRKDSELLKLNINNATDGDYVVRIKNATDGRVFRTIMLFRKLVPLKEEPDHLIAKLYAFYCIENKQLRVSDEEHGNIIVNPSDSTVVFRGAFDAEKELLLSKLREEGMKWNETTRQLLPLHEEPEELPTNEETEDDETNEFNIDFVEFDNHRFVTKLQKGIISVNTRNHSGRITFNRIDTKEVRKKNITYAMVGKTPSGDVMIMLCKNKKGIPIVFNTDNYLNINSNQFCEHFKRLLNIISDLEYLQIDKVAEKMDSITYKVTKQQ